VPFDYLIPLLIKPQPPPRVSTISTLNVLVFNNNNNNHPTPLPQAAPQALAAMDDASSFTSLAKIPLAKAHVLHPAACNPTMDLVLLLLEDTEKRAVGTTAELWRMSGSRVWSAQVSGRVLGLAWSRDGELHGSCKADVQARTSPSWYCRTRRGLRLRPEAQARAGQLSTSPYTPASASRASRPRSRYCENWHTTTGRASAHPARRGGLWCGLRARRSGRNMW
jgi:hypothetical protein